MVARVKTPTHEVRERAAQEQRQRWLVTVDEMEASGSMTPRACAQLRTDIEAGEETYAWTGAHGAMVWVGWELRHFTADEYDAFCATRLDVRP